MTTPEVPLLKAPQSFNLRSMTHAMKSVQAALYMMRTRSAQGLGGQCTPVVTHEGYVNAGETRSCYQIGTVDSGNEELTEAVLNMGSCNKCGLEANLDQKHKRAIGLAKLHLSNEK